MNSKLIRRNPDVMFSEVDAEIILMNLESGAYFNLNPVGSEIWKLIGDEGNTSDAIASELTEIFDVSQAECEARIGRFVEKLLECKAIIVD